MVINPNAKLMSTSNYHFNSNRSPIKLQLQLPELSITQAAQASRERWKSDLANLLKHANNRFADLAWSIAPHSKEQIWAHKAIIYARAGGQFQLKYLSSPAPPPHSRIPPLPSNASSVSISPFPTSLRSVTPQSNRRPSSPGGNSLNSLSTSTRQVSILNGTDPTLFQSILEALYTANGLSEVFSFLFDDHTSGDGPEARTDKLRRDLLYMWRSKLYSDCHIILVSEEGLDHTEDGNQTTEQAVFSAHRSILCSRSPYFASLLLDPYADSSKRVFTLASPPFTPASLHFSLGYLYCGTLEFSNRTFDLATAMQIWRSAQYLGLELLKEEVEAKISDMCHNFKDNSEPFVVQYFGLIWNKAIGELHYGAQTRIVDLVCSSIDPNTVIDAIRSSKRLKERLANERSDWSDHLLSMLEPIDEQIALVLQRKFPAVVTSKGFLDLLVGVGFSNDVLERALIILIAQLSEETAAETYQVLVGQVLLREDGLPMDARVIVEDAKASVIKYLKSRWMNVRSLNGFDPLENWALKEIADEIGVTVDDLLLSTVASNAPTTKTGLRVTSPASKDNQNDDKHVISPASLRASVLCRNASRQQATPTPSVSGRVTTKSTSSASTVTTNRLHLSNVTNNSPTPSISSSLISRPRPSIGKQKALLPSVITATRRESESGSIVSSPISRRPSVQSNETSTSTSSSSALSPKPEPVGIPKPQQRAVSSSATSSHSIRSNPPLPPMPKSANLDSPRLSANSRASSPTHSVTSVSSRSVGKRSTSVVGRARRPSEMTTSKPNTTEPKPSKPPRTRTITGTSTISIRSTASATPSRVQAPATPNGRKSFSKPDTVRKTPSSLSMRSDASNATVGAVYKRRPSAAAKTPTSYAFSETPPMTPPAATIIKKKNPPTVTLAAKRPDRLRTTSATARTSAATTVLRTAQPVPVPPRPSSVTSVRTNASTKTNGATKASGIKSEPNSSGIAKSVKAKSKDTTALMPTVPSVRARTVSTNSVTPGVRARIMSTKLPSPLVTQATRQRKASAMSEVTRTPKATKEPKESKKQVEEDSKSEHEPGHQSQGSNASNSTVRLGTSKEAPQQTIIVTPSSSPSLHRISANTVVPPIPQPGGPLPGFPLLVGIPCVVATTTTLPDGMIQPIKFRAVVKYLGKTFFGSGEWVGVEVAEKENMPEKEWNEGMIDGIRYFELGQESNESKSRLMRNLSATPSGAGPGLDRNSPSSRLGSPGSGSRSGTSSVNGGEFGVGSLGLRPTMNSNNSRSSSRLKHVGSDEEIDGISNGLVPTRGLFVKPHEVIFVF
ncbi:uncharacterized protein MELLADRAFT_62956 [Melampsora larici-populina 98AG31]|uniref:BTB domain-containing protein n=1 Tax=Melampsora larici-populina (strain 98AG31 / pathotype 3-4-7) TaxID=747676 RepID=F4RKR9_MELLP|nr:uncharacterized protein MELLADRAFT_62956 [Melampsora larici-populina 98AG31]EGG06777.1 hypothetical protein MELLADRAFT_62956 [Melampsora larici-populina 98AG31]